MANEVKFLYRSGENLTFSAFTPNGSLRGDAGQTLAEVGVTGYYTATPSSPLVSGDCVAVYLSGTLIGTGEYRPEVVATSVTSARIINGTFDYDVAPDEPIEGWTRVGDGDSYTEDGVLIIVPIGIVDVGVYQTIDGFSNGAYYRLQYTISATDSITFTINEQSIISSEDTVTAGTYTFNFFFDNTKNSQIRLVISPGSGVEIDDIILKEFIGEQEAIIESQTSIIENQATIINNQTAQIQVFRPGE